MGMGIQQQEEQVAMGANKRRRPQSHDEEDDNHRRQQGADDLNLNLKKKKQARRLLPVPWMTDKMAAMKTELPRVLTEYTTEDAARFDEDMARTDKLLDKIVFFDPVTSREPVVPCNPPGLLLFEQEEEEGEEVMVGDLCVSKADIKMLRSFIASSSGYFPISERFLRDRSLITQARADKCRKNDRLFSKLYAWSQEGAREVLRHYDAATAAAKGGSSSSSSDGAIPAASLTRRPADH